MANVQDLDMDDVEIGEETFPGPRPDFELAGHPMVEIFARA